MNLGIYHNANFKIKSLILSGEWSLSHSSFEHYVVIYWDFAGSMYNLNCGVANYYLTKNPSKI